jgi:hypothetical protein
MAAGAWKLMNKAKYKIGKAVMNLSTSTWRIALVKTLGATPAAVSLLGSFTQVASANGYSSSGKALVTEAWTVSTGGAGTWKFDADDVVWTATGGAIASIKAAVIYASGASAGACHALCYSTLTGTQFTLAQNNTLTVQMAATGIFVCY